MKGKAWGSGKISLRREYGYYCGRWREGYFLRYYEFGPIYNVYNNMTDALKSIKHCHQTKLAIYNLAGVRQWPSSLGDGWIKFMHKYSADIKDVVLYNG